MAIENSLILNIPHHSTFIPFYYYDKAFFPTFLDGPSYTIEKRKRVLSIMIELNRSLYLIKDTKDKNESFQS